MNDLQALAAELKKRLPALGAPATRSSVVIPGYGRVKCDRAAAIMLAREYGGHVEVSSIRIFPDGSEHLGPWREADRWETDGTAS